MKPLVSVIVPVHNGERFVGEALASVMNQTCQPLEVLAIDDGSSDRSVAIIQSFPTVHCIVQPNAGVGAARNRGVQESTSEFLAFLDQDDIWLPGKIEAQLRLALADPSLDYVLTWQKRFLQHGTERPKWARPGTIDVPLKAADPSALFVRRSSFLRVGLFDPSYTMAPDSDWFFKAKDLGLRSAWLPDVLLLRRVHAENNSRFALGSAELRRVALGSIRRQRTATSDPS